MVVEADEYNRHFLNFHPFITVITNIEADHLDCYKDLADIKNAFDKFLSQSENKILDYIKYLEKVPKLIIPGIHNRMNAAAALAVADFLNIKNEDAQKSIMNFLVLGADWKKGEKQKKEPLFMMITPIIRQK